MSCLSIKKSTVQNDCLGMVIIIHSAVPNKEARNAIRRLIKIQIKIKTCHKMKVEFNLHFMLKRSVCEKLKGSAISN